MKTEALVPSCRLSADIRAELLRLNDHFVVTVDQLIDILAKTPSQYSRAVEAVIAALRNLMHAVNLLRPLQARATLKHMLQLEVTRKQEAIQKLKAHAQNVSEKIKETSELLIQPVAQGAGVADSSAGPSTIVN